MYVDNFNTQQDLVDGYGYLNAQIRFAPTDGNWHMRFFMQNVTNNDAITGAFNSGETSGNFPEPLPSGAAPLGLRAWHDVLVPGRTCITFSGGPRAARFRSGGDFALSPG